MEYQACIPLLAGLLLAVINPVNLAAECPCRAPELMETFLTIDTHVDIPGEGYGSGDLDPGTRSDKLQVDLVKMAEGGLDCVFLASYVGQGPLTDEGFTGAREEALRKIAAIRRVCLEQYPERVGMATTPSEVVKTVASGRRCVVIGMENGYPLGEDLSNVKKYYDLGVRYITLSHVGHNQICDSANEKWLPSAAELGDTLDAAGMKVLRFLYNAESIFSEKQAPPRWGGLSPFGEQVVREMNRLGMLIDLSHVSDSTFYDVLRLTKAPVIVSHSTCRSLCGLSRSLSDEQLLALRDNGGVIQINALAAYVKFPKAEHREMEALCASLGGRGLRERLFSLNREDRATYDSLVSAATAAEDSLTARYTRATVADYVDHIDHVVNLIGADYVGIGTDFDGGGGLTGLDSASDYVNVTEEMIRRGYTVEQMGKIWGDNLLRVWNRVEKAARPNAGG